MSDAPSGQAITDAAATQQPGTAAPAQEAPAAGTAPATQPAQQTAPAADGTQAQPTEVKTEAPAGAPEKYEFKAPDGVELAEATVTRFSEVARAANLTQEQAQGILGEMASAIQQQSRASLEAFYKDIGGMPETWADQVRADKEFGGLKLEENLGIAAKARDAFGGPELKMLFDKTGIGNHPALVRAFVKIGKAISQDGFVSGGGSGATSTKSYADRLYGSN